MNYDFYLAGNGGNISDTIIGTVNREPWERPVIGNEIRIKSKIFKVIRTDPTDNPDNTTVKYYVEPLNPNWPYRNK